MKVVLRSNGRPLTVETDQIETVRPTSEANRVCEIVLMDTFVPIPVDQAGAEMLAETIYKDYLRDKGFCQDCYMHGRRSAPCAEICCQLRAVCLRSGAEVSRHAPRETPAPPEEGRDPILVCGWFVSCLVCSLLWGFRYGLFRAVGLVGGLSVVMLLNKIVNKMRRRR